MKNESSSDYITPSACVLSNGEQLDRMPIGEATDVYRAPDRQVKAKIRWEWNVPFLATSFAAVTVLLVSLAVIHAIQARRVAEGLSNLAKKAMAQQDHAMEAKWLKQLVAFDFRYDRALERLAIATNQSVKTPEDIDEARRTLTRAIASMDETSDRDRIQSLRRLLIPRLLEIPTIWAMEAEKQTLLLSAAEDDKDALRWLALSTFTQVENGEWRTRDKARYDKRKDHWAWMSTQPVGQILEYAEAANPESLDIKIALLSAYIDRPELFDVPLDDESRNQFRGKAKLIIENLQNLEDGRAQWACFTFAEKIDRQQAETLLNNISATAVKRLRVVEKSVEGKNRQGIFSNTKYWDMTIALAKAARLNVEKKFSEADELYQVLITVDKNQIPESQLADLFLQYGLLHWRQGKYDSALEILRQGCQATRPSAGLEMWELIASIQCQRGDRDEAAIAIRELEEATQQARDLYLMSPVRDGLREQELKRLAQVRWHAAVLRCEQSLKDDTNWETIQNLVTLLQAQNDIPSNLRLDAHVVLADAYSRIGFWDLEARTLEDALSLASDDKLLRKRIADAWLKGGVLIRAESHLKLADDGSFNASLALLQVTLDIQKTTPLSARKVDRLRQLQNQARRRLNEETAAGKVNDRAWMLDLIELSNVVDALESDQLRVSLDSEQGISELTAAYPDDAELQALAAISFAAAGRQEKTESALRNLERLKTNSPQVWFDTTLRVNLLLKRISQAKELVRNVFDERILPELTLRRLAARAFSESGDMDEACRILLAAKDSNDVAYLFLLANNLFKVVSAERVRSDATPSENEFASALKEVVLRVQELEGPRGILGQFLVAADLLRSSRADTKSKNLDQATKIMRRVVDARPRWVEGLQLAGDVRSAAGDAEEAVSFYRRAIAEGDTRVITVFQLTQQLSQLGRFTEAESEFQRIAHLSQASRAISEFAISLEQRKGNDARALELARDTTDRYPQDSSAWLIRAQTALQQQAIAEEGGPNLVDEAEECYRKANEISKGGDLSIWIAYLRFSARFRGPEETEVLVDQLRASPLSEKSRGLLTAQAYLSLREYPKAVASLTSASRAFPYDIDILSALYEAYRLSGQSSLAIEALEKAYRLNPKRSDIARSLAVMLATNAATGASVPWDRISNIIEGIDAPNAEFRKLFYAFLLVTRGEKQLLTQALGVLDDLTLSSDRIVAGDAIRLSMAIHRDAWEEAAKDKRNDKMQVEVREVQRLFEILWRAPDHSALVNDLYQYADFLLQAGERLRVSELIDEFDRLAPGSPLLLNLRFQVAVAEGKTNSLPEKVRQWVGKETERRNAPLLAEAGRLLSEVGMVQEAIPYLKSAYQIDSQWLRPLIVGLSRAGNIDEALELCVERYRIEPTVDVVSLLADLAILSVGRTALDPRIEQMMQESLVRFPSNHKLLELVGTLRLFQQRYQESLELLLQAEKLAPRSAAALNNLAMAASEIPGREVEGLARIEKAIEIHGRTPELLDTLGIVQLACGRAKQAEASLKESWEAKQDSRTLLHWIQSLQAQGKQTEIRERLRFFNLSDLKGQVLTPREQESIEMLRQSNSLPTSSKESS